MKNMLIIALLILVVAMGYGLIWSTQKVSNLEAEMELKAEEEKEAEEMMQEEEVEEINLEESMKVILGAWQSTEDEKSTVVFKDDGTVVDIYEGEELASDNWSLTVELDYNHTPSLHLTRTNEEEVFKYVIWELENEKLVMNYLNSGNTLEYMRVPEVE